MDFPNAIVEFFDGTFIDLGRILEISPTIVGQNRGVSFSILYMLQSEPRHFFWDRFSVLPMSEQQTIHKRWDDIDRASSDKTVNIVARAQDEISERSLEIIEAHRQALVAAWKAYRGKSVASGIVKVSATPAAGGETS